jgi:hypothetical protein
MDLVKYCRCIGLKWNYFLSGDLRKKTVMTDCNCNICIGREDIDGETVCPYVKKSFISMISFFSEVGGEEVILLEKKKKFNKEVFSYISIG